MAQSAYSLSSTVKVNNGSSIPLIQLGVYMVSGQETMNHAVHTALGAGYRGIDSAEWYQNEREVGRAVRSFLSSPDNKASLRREDIEFTTKLKSNISYSATRKSIKRSIEESGLGYIDLYLLHSPYGGKSKRLECWRAVEDAIGEGEIKIGGVSNFGIKHLEELLASTPRVTPAVNQVEIHPFNTQSKLSKFCQKKGIVVQAWGPLVRGMRMEHHTISSLAKKYTCSPAQLLIRWSLQHGYVPLPKSVTPHRIIENGQVHDVEIEAFDMEKLDALDEHLVTDWDPTNTD
ncbi:uncharacterized protein KY384_006768 [Bacidia gigantensis]|uniref:uncharacterized protein n=1 Tax=Bacidia gigantensis TaxID=2732470 RepID=UPI001D039366|nr:uncharacterized protein KY384_006768 [Bacidia gigantensis]KAG8527852.1 hypothetical protein KY384_006768 [Bacidia gigantensis]